MKDFYDLYYLITYEKFSNKNLKEAIIKTFKKRNTEIESIKRILKDIKQSEFLEELWKNYREKHKYVENLNFEEVMEKISRISILIS